MSSKPILLTNLQENGLLETTIGILPKNPKPAIVIWGKHYPRHDNLPLLLLATLATGLKPIVYVDDIASQAFCNRTLEEQENYNNKYVSFFADHGCTVRFSSEIYQEKFGNNTISALLALASRTSVSQFMRSLPEKKISATETLPVNEIMNMLLELLLFEQVSKECNTLVIRHFTQGIVYSHRNVAESPLVACVLPILKDNKAIDDYILRAGRFV